MTEVIEEQNYKQSTETQMTWTITQQGKVLALNQMFKAYVGITTAAQEEVADIFHDSVVHPDDYRASKEVFAQANINMKPFEIKRRLKSCKGTYRWFHTKAIPVYSTQGHFKFWVGGCTDIDDAEVLKNEMGVFQDKLPVFLWKCKVDGSIFYRNPSFIEYSGSNGEILNYFDPNVIYISDFRCASPPMRRILNLYLLTLCQRELNLKLRFECADPLMFINGSKWRALRSLMEMVT